MYAVIYRKHFSIKRLSKALPSSSGFSLNIGIGHFVGHASSIILVYDTLVSVFLNGYQVDRNLIMEIYMIMCNIVRYFH